MGNNQTHQYLSLKSKILTLAPHSVIFPFYHAVSDHVGPHLKNLYRVQGIKDFEKSIDGLLYCMNPLSVEDAITNFSKWSYGKPSFHLSFDDGLRETKDIIAPILLRKGIPATFFITAGFTNNKILFHRHKASLIVEKLKTSNSNIVETRIGSILNIPKVDHASLQKAIFSINFQTSHILDEIAEILDVDFTEFLNNEKPYINASEIIDLDNNGFSIGLHSLNHPEFYLLNESEMEYQVTESQKLVNELTGIESKLFSYPFTDSGIPDHFIKKIIDKYKMTTFGTAGIKDEPTEGHFQRIPMEVWRSDSSISLVANEIIRYRLKVIFGRQKVKR